MPSLKDRQRRAARQARALQADKDLLSAIICKRVIELPDYLRARTVLWYVGCQAEVKTLPAIERALAEGKRVVIPYCTHDARGERKLGLWHLESLDELAPGTWNIPEPPRARWGEADKEIAPAELDLVVVPGVAFDRDGGRLGNGAGYYDRLLAEVRPDARLYGVCFEAQLLDAVAIDAHDIPMDAVCTEAGVYFGNRRRLAK